VSHRYRVREIAQQAGLSEATVDRVLHNRPNVRESTRREVEQAIGDLDKQRSQLRLAGRKYLVDVVMQAPQRFSSAFQAAVEAELPALAPAVVRCRFHFRETGSVPAMVETLDKIGARGSHGVIVKAPDTDLVAEAIDRLTAEGIPVVTFVTDVPRTSRVGYVGVDNRDAGATAAYLIDQWLGDSPTPTSARCIPSAAATSPPSVRSSGAAAATGCSSPTISTRTTGRYCAPARSRPCYITTCGPTPTSPGG